jgi:hypothetical protein
MGAKNHGDILLMKKAWRAIANYCRLGEPRQPAEQSMVGAFRDTAGVNRLTALVSVGGKLDKVVAITLFHLPPLCMLAACVGDGYLGRL